MRRSGPVQRRRQLERLSGAGTDRAVRYAQIKTRPPTFALFAAKADDLPDAYARYLINGIRERFDLKGTPIRLQLKRTDNPFADKE